MGHINAYTSFMITIHNGHYIDDNSYVVLK